MVYQRVPASITKTELKGFELILKLIQNNKKIVITEAEVL